MPITIKFTTECYELPKTRNKISKSTNETNRLTISLLHLNLNKNQYLSMKNIKSLCLVVISILFGATGCISYPKSEEKNFQLAGKNNCESKAEILRYSTHHAYIQKRKAIMFLIENMESRSFSLNYDQRQTSYNINYAEL